MKQILLVIELYMRQKVYVEHTKQR